MEHRDNKLKANGKKEMARQQKYDELEKTADDTALKKFRAKPYQLQYLEKLKGGQSR